MLQVGGDETVAIVEQVSGSATAQVAEQERGVDREDYEKEAGPASHEQKQVRPNGRQRENEQAREREDERKPGEQP
jgi:hypothetical protein